MKAYRITKRIAPQGDLHLSALPFQEGQLVEVIVLSRAGDEEEPDRRSLHGSVQRYDGPTDPVAADDWDSLR